MKKWFALGLLVFALLLLSVPNARAQAPTEPGSVKQDSVTEVSKLSADDMVAVQLQLQAAGFNPGPINGQGVDRTQEAIRQFQGAKGLKATGQIDPETRSALASVSGIGTLDEGSDQ